MSSQARKLAKKIVLTQVRTGGSKHGCAECRAIEWRQSITRKLASEQQLAALVACPACAKAWHVAFGADSAGDAVVSWTPQVLS